MAFIESTIFAALSSVLPVPAPLNICFAGKDISIVSSIISEAPKIQFLSAKSNLLTFELEGPL